MIIHHLASIAAFTDPPAVVPFTVRWNFSIKCSPDFTGAYLGFSPGARHVGMQRISASQFGWWKKAMDCRRVEPLASAGGFTTRCSVETQRSFVHRAIKSPMFTMNAPGTLGTATHFFSGVKISSPPGAGSESKIVRLP